MHFLPLNSNVPLLPPSSLPSHLLKILWHVRAQRVPPGLWGHRSGLDVTPPPPPLVAQGLFWEKAPHTAWALGQAAKQMKSVSVGVSVSSPGPPEEALGPLPSPRTRAGAQACCRQLCLQLCCCSLQECGTGPNVPGRYPMWVGA